MMLNPLIRFLWNKILKASGQSSMKLKMHNNKPPRRSNRETLSSRESNKVFSTLL